MHLSVHVSKYVTAWERWRCEGVGEVEMVSVDTRIRVNNEMDLLPSTVEPLLQPHHLSTNPPNMENFLEENKRCIRGSGTIVASAAINYCSGEVRQGEVG